MSEGEKKPPFEIDLRTSTPAYIQIMLRVQELILRGKLQPGEQLPTVRSMAANQAINFNTVARAYRLLDRAGLITTQQGRGTFVLDSREAHQNLRHEVLRELTTQYLGEMQRLDFPPDEVLKAFQKQFDRWTNSEEPGTVK